MARSILLTAFGPFGGRRLNASTLALEALRRHDRSFRYRILPVDLVEAPRRLRAAMRQHAPHTVVLLGEAGKAERIRLERRAWNELDFSIPDIAGRQPRGLRIDPAGPDFLATSLPVAALRRAMVRAGHEVELSTDPGRYLCNRLYHAALGPAGGRALFVHLPLESQLAPEAAAGALRTLLKQLGTHSWGR